MMLNDTVNLFSINESVNWYFLSWFEIHVVKSNMHRCRSFGAKPFLLQVKDHYSAAIATSTAISFPPEQFLGSILFGKIYFLIKILFQLKIKSVILKCYGSRNDQGQCLYIAKQKWIPNIFLIYVG